jgi:phosphoglucomutase
MDYMKGYETWLKSEKIDEETKKELEAIKEDSKEIQERFYKDLEFGTGGLRGILGAGTNRMNIYTVRKATQGLANFILKDSEDNRRKGVAIAYDSRRMSVEFADEAALVLNANGIKAYVFESLRPTPELSFAVRKLGCIAGIVITASHNPPEYNGYKAYWEDGGQVTSPKDVQIIEEVSKVKSIEDVKTMDKEMAISEGLYHVLGKEMDDQYIAELKKLVIDFDVIKTVADDFNIVYTPLHGTGNIPARRILEEIGFKHVEVVKEQELPDGNFPTVGYPNPEDIKAFKLAIDLGEKTNADILLATDPDADRLGVLAKTKAGNYEALNGNMVGVLLLDYIITRKIEKGTLPENGAVIETIVSTNMGKAVADYYQVDLIEVLTGFKYIGEKIKEFEETNSHEYLFGFEESYGCLIGTHARDKDAIVATMGICEVAAYYASKGMTLYDALLQLYEKYGYYKESLASITLKGIEGIETIKYVLSTLRQSPLEEINGVKVTKIRDYMSGEIKDLATGAVSPTGLPESNVLYYELEDDAWLCVRPSGTEPKVKFYVGVKGNSLEAASDKSNEFSKAVLEQINTIIENKK